METVVDSNEQIKEGLPPFLNVLTILTFIGGGVFILSAIYSLSTVELQKQQLELMSKSGELEKIPLFGADALRVMELSIKYRWEINLTSIVCCILCIVAALMMRKLKRSGYFIYVLAQVVSVALPAYFLGQNSIFSLVFSILFPLAFIIMYGANLKHLK